MQAIDIESLVASMLAAATQQAGPMAGDVKKCLEERLDSIAEWADLIKAAEDAGELSEAKKKYYVQRIEEKKKRAIEVCEYLGKAIIQAAMDAAIKVFWKVVNAAIGSA